MCRVRGGNRQGPCVDRDDGDGFAIWHIELIDLAALWQKVNIDHMLSIFPITHPCIAGQMRSFIRLSATPGKPGACKAVNRSKR